METRIHPTATIMRGAVIGEGSDIGPHSVVHANVRLGGNSTVGAFCELGHPRQGGDDTDRLVIGERAVIRSHSVLYAGSEFGDDLATGHRVTVREGTKAGRGLQVGTLGDIQGNCEIGEFCKFHSNVHIGQGSVVEDFVWIFPFVVLTNDPHPPSEVRRGVRVGKFSAIATMSVVLPGVQIGVDCLIGAHSSVTRDIEAGKVAVGSPAKVIGDVGMVKLQDGSGMPAYPWRRHFHRGYPEDVVESWRTEFDRDSAAGGPQ